jgi:hypothetical protein
MTQVCERGEEKVEGEKRPTYLEPIISPTREFHLTLLLIKGEVLNIDLTGGLENGCTQPRQVPIVSHDNVGTQCGQVVLRVRTTEE